MLLWELDTLWSAIASQSAPGGRQESGGRCLLALLPSRQPKDWLVAVLSNRFACHSGRCLFHAGTSSTAAAAAAEAVVVEEGGEGVGEPASVEGAS